MSKPTFVALDCRLALCADPASKKPDIDTAGFDLLVEPTWHPSTDPSEIAQRVKGARFVWTCFAPIGEEALGVLASDASIFVAASGVEQVDLEAAKKKGVKIYHVPRYCNESVAAYVMDEMHRCCTLSFKEELADKGRTWDESWFQCSEDLPLKGKTLGILGGGKGSIGEELAKRARAEGMRVVFAQVPGSRTSEAREPLEQVLPQVDFFSVHCPITDRTKRLLGYRELCWMKLSSVFINTARGLIVGERALSNALLLPDKGPGFAILDVREHEPPSIAYDVLVGNLFVRETPHVAWRHLRSARVRLMYYCLRNLRDALSDSPSKPGQGNRLV